MSSHKDAFWRANNPCWICRVSAGEDAHQGPQTHPRTPKTLVRLQQHNEYATHSTIQCTEIKERSTNPAARRASQVVRHYSSSGTMAKPTCKDYLLPTQLSLHFSFSATRQSSYKHLHQQADSTVPMAL